MATYKSILTLEDWKQAVPSGQSLIKQGEMLIIQGENLIKIANEKIKQLEVN